MGYRMLKRRAARRGWTQAELNEKLANRREIKEKIKGSLLGLGVIVQPLAEAALSVVPGGGMLAKGVSKIPGLNKLPVLKTVVDEGASQFDLKVAQDGGPVAAAKDIFMPAAEAWEDGEYFKAVAQIAVVALAVFLIVWL